MKTGVYFLLKNRKVIYIGKTTRWPFRLKQHLAQCMDYDNVRFIECHESRLGGYEIRWIRRFNPEYNMIQYKPKEKPKTRKGITTKVKSIKAKKDIMDAFEKYANSRGETFNSLLVKYMVKVTPKEK